MKRRTLRTALTLVAMAGMVAPAAAQDQDQSPERVQEQQLREDAAQRRKEALDKAVKNGTLTRERADEINARSKEGFEQRQRARGSQPDRQADGQAGRRGDQPDRNSGQGRAMRERMGNDALPAQINKLFDLRDAQHAEVNKLIREFRNEQMQVLREIRTGRAGERGQGGPDARPPRDGQGDRDARLPRDGQRDREAQPQRGGQDDRDAQRPRDGQGDRDARPQRGGGDDADAQPLRGPRVGGQDGQRQGGRDAMTDRPNDQARGQAQRGPGGMGQMDDGERREMLRLAREKMAPINRAFTKDLAAILHEDQRPKLRENFKSLDLMHPMIARMIEAQKKSKEAKAKGQAKETKGDGKEKGKQADRDRDGGGADEARQERGGRGGQGGGKGGRDGGGG